MKKINIIKGLIVSIIIFLAFSVSKADSGLEIDLNSPIVIKTTVKTDEQRWNLYDYHESDDLLVRTDEYEIYLNQTSPIRDTIYLLIFKY